MSGRLDSPVQGYGFLDVNFRTAILAGGLRDDHLNRTCVGKTSYQGGYYQLFTVMHTSN